MFKLILFSFLILFAVSSQARKLEPKVLVPNLSPSNNSAVFTKNYAKNRQIKGIHIIFCSVYQNEVIKVFAKNGRKIFEKKLTINLGSRTHKFIHKLVAHNDFIPTLNKKVTTSTDYWVYPKKKDTLAVIPGDKRAMSLENFASIKHAQTLIDIIDHFCDK